MMQKIFISDLVLMLVFDIFTFWIIKASPAGHYDSFKNAVPFLCKKRLENSESV